MIMTFIPDQSISLLLSVFKAGKLAIFMILL